MPIWVYAESDPDPWTACHCSVTSHPHYHDCENCDYAKYGICDIGKSYLALKQIEEFKAHLKDFEKSLPPYPALDPKRLP